MERKSGDMGIICSFTLFSSGDEYSAAGAKLETYRKGAQDMLKLKITKKKRH